VKINVSPVLLSGKQGTHFQSCNYQQELTGETMKN